MRLLPPAPPVDAEVGPRGAVRFLVYGLCVRLDERLEHAVQLCRVVHEAELGLDVRQDVPEEGVRGRVREQREEGGVEEALSEREHLYRRGVVSSR